MNLVEDVVHRITDRARHRAIDSRGGRLVFLRAGVRRDATSRNGAATQRPKKTLVPMLALLRRLNISQRTSDTAVGIVHRLVDRIATLGNQAVFLVPNIEGRLLKRNRIDIAGRQLDHAIHLGSDPLKIFDMSVQIRFAREQNSPVPACFHKYRTSDERNNALEDDFLALPSFDPGTPCHRSPSGRTRECTQDVVSREGD